MNGVTGTPARARLMNACQVMAGQVPPYTGSTPLTSPIGTAWLLAFPIHTAVDRVGV